MARNQERQLSSTEKALDYQRVKWLIIGGKAHKITGFGRKLIARIQHVDVIGLIWKCTSEAEELRK